MGGGGYKAILWKMGFCKKSMKLLKACKPQFSPFQLGLQSGRMLWAMFAWVNSNGKENPVGLPMSRTEMQHGANVTYIRILA